MPKESKAATSNMHWTTAPYQLAAQPVQASSVPAVRSAAIWNVQDDEILLQARASGLNWQPIASRHFPNKTANACRKRHERLIERRHAEDWDAQKLDILAQEYMACRREMWEMLASRIGERWNVVEAKCMEKGLRTLQSAARTAHRRASASYTGSYEEAGSGNSDHHSDSGIGLGSDAEMEASDEAVPRSYATDSNTTAPSWPNAYPHAQQARQHAYVDHNRSQSLPLALPMYRPPPPVVVQRPAIDAPPPQVMHPQYSTRDYRSIPEQYVPSRAPQRKISIQSVLAPSTEV